MGDDLVLWGRVGEGRGMTDEMSFSEWGLVLAGALWVLSGLAGGVL